ncbi:MAG: DIP1984 family protein [Sarcina sp.]
MKLAEALINRKNLEIDLNKLNRGFIAEVVTDKSYEDIGNLNKAFEKYIKLYEEHEEIINTINKVNADSYDGVTNIELLTKRKILINKFNSMSEIYKATRVPLRQASYMDTVIEKKLNIDKSIIKKELDKTSKELRELEVKIQSRNWTIEL